MKALGRAADRPYRHEDGRIAEVLVGPVIGPEADWRQQAAFRHHRVVREHAGATPAALVQQPVEMGEHVLDGRPALRVRIGRSDPAVNIEGTGRIRVADLRIVLLPPERTAALVLDYGNVEFDVARLESPERRDGDSNGQQAVAQKRFHDLAVWQVFRGNWPVSGHLSSPASLAFTPRGAVDRGGSRAASSAG